MANNDKWAEAFRKQTAAHKEPAPEDMWQRLDADLKKADAQKHKGLVIPWKRIASVAAAIAVIATVTISVWKSHNTPNIQSQFDSHPEIAINGNKTISEPKKEEINCGKESVTHSFPKVQESELLPIARNTESVTSVADSVSRPTTVKADLAVTEQPKQQSLDKKPSRHNNEMTYPEINIKGKKSKTDSWSFGLVALNGGSGNYNEFKNGYAQFPAPQKRKDFTDKSAETKSPMAAYNDIIQNNSRNNGKTMSKIEHRMPISYGATARYYFDDVWSIETGITYTFLYSRLVSGSYSDNYEQRQELHYIGIPVKMHRTIFEKERLSIYAAAGGSVEKCVKGTLMSELRPRIAKPVTETTDLSIKQMQLSLNAAVGLQFNVVGGLSIYAEPGAAYYFDDNSMVSTIRKEKPFNFQLQLGVRFDINK